MKTTFFITLFLYSWGCFAQQPYEGPYLEALVKYKFRSGEEAQNPGWGMGFRMDTAERRYVQIANDGWLTKSEFWYDDEGKTVKEAAIQLTTGIRQMYTYSYQWHGDDMLQSFRSDYLLTTNYNYKNKLLNAVENIHYAYVCNIINDKPVEPETPVPANTSCFEKVTFIRDSAGNIVAKEFANYYSRFTANPIRKYHEEYRKNPKGQIDTAWILDDNQYIVMAFEYNKKNRITRASRRKVGLAAFEIWEFKYKRNGLLKKVTYRDFPGKMWQDKYRWKKHKWKQAMPTIPNLEKFITSHDLKLGKDFYFGY